ncbi:hypothetical protein BDB01DRAFT_786851 [Pilobolus umbonatus]|nr:hypothetical protein BDB01DRAFT_786851 [Pilobolus umbonatus]
MSSKNQFIDATGRMSESTIRIQDLHQVEKKIVMLIETAAEAFSILSEENITDNTNTEQFIRESTRNFRDLASRYFSLINDIQLTLRNHTHYLTKEANITSSVNKTIPFKISIAGEEKELEAWIAAIETIHDRIREIKRMSE